MAAWAIEPRAGAVSPELLLSVYFITATGRETKAGYECYLVTHWVGPSTTEGERKKAKAGSKSKPLIWREAQKSAHSLCGCGCADMKKGARVCEESLLA